MPRKTTRNYDSLMLTEEKSSVGLERRGIATTPSFVFLKTKKKICIYALIHSSKKKNVKKKKKRKKSIFTQK